MGTPFPPAPHPHAVMALLPVLTAQVYTGARDTHNSYKDNALLCVHERHKERTSAKVLWSEVGPGVWDGCWDAVSDFQISSFFNSYCKSLQLDTQQKPGEKKGGPLFKTMTNVFNKGTISLDKVSIFLELKSLYQEWIKRTQVNKQIKSVAKQSNEWYPTSSFVVSCLLLKTTYSQRQDAVYIILKNTLLLSYSS